MLSPDFFDLIIIDECHRSIYSDWQKVLTYFNTARLVGMTATPIPETLAFFDNNRVANYTYEQSVLDDVNVSFRIYRIKTELTEEGGTIETGDKLEVTNRLDAKRHQQVAIEEREFSKADLNRRVVVRDQIRKVLQEYKDAVYTQFYPEREPNFDYLPKTLIFAQSDAHAQLIVEVAKEVFNRTDDHFVQKITYSIGNSNERIKQFRYDVNFRIAVTVTLVATGTDVRPLEVLIFFNNVHSETLYAQMKGRGCRTITPSQLQAVTPNAKSKELFYIVDAVGVTESEKYVPSLDGKDGLHPINPTLEALFEQMALGHLPDDYFHLLASKLSCIGNRADPEDLQEYAEFSPISPLTWAKTIMDALDKGNLPPFVSASHENRERMAVVRDLLTNIPARKKLVEIAKGYVKEILGKTDSVVFAGFSMENAKASTTAFEEYVRAHRDDIEALRLIYNQESGKITRATIDDLAKHLSIISFLTETKTGETTREERYFITSYPYSANGGPIEQSTVELMAQCVTSHWYVESTHWHLDLNFKQDAFQCQDPYYLFAATTVIKVALNLVKAFQEHEQASKNLKRARSVERCLKEFAPTLAIGVKNCEGLGGEWANVD